MSKLHHAVIYAKNDADQPWRIVHAETCKEGTREGHLVITMPPMLGAYRYWQVESWTFDEEG